MFKQDKKILKTATCKLNYCDLSFNCQLKIITLNYVSSWLIIVELLPLQDVAKRTGCSTREK